MKPNEAWFCPKRPPCLASRTWLWWSYPEGGGWCRPGYHAAAAAATAACLLPSIKLPGLPFALPKAVNADLFSPLVDLPETLSSMLLFYHSNCMHCLCVSAFLHKLVNFLAWGRFLRSQLQDVIHTLSALHLITQSGPLFCFTVNLTNFRSTVVDFSCGYESRRKETQQQMWRTLEQWRSFS